jgi:hypothetical protein
MTRLTLDNLARHAWSFDINLFGTDVTDEGLKHLKGLEFLQRLELGETEVTENGVRALQKAIPECGISYGRSSSPRSLNPTSYRAHADSSQQ